MSLPDQAEEATAAVDFGRLLSPKSVVVVGASEDGKRIGGQPARYLKEYGYQGRVYAVNPKYRDIRGVPCFASVAEVPEACDVAVVAVTAARVPGVIAECAARGIRHAIVLSAGFREVGEAGAKLEAELKSVVRSTGIRVVGPNCVGLVNLRDRVFNGFGSGMQQASELRIAPIAIVSQSGGYGYTMVSAAASEGLGFSHIVSTGNSADVSLLDFLEYFVESPDIEVVATFIEGVADGRRLMRIGRRALELGKPILVWKAGVSKSGGQAAQSHTASLASAYELYKAAFREGAFLEIEDAHDFVDLARAFRTRSRPRGNRVAVVATSGGTGVVLADRAEQHGLVLPPLADTTVERLQQIVPAYASVANPLDLSAQQPGFKGSCISNAALGILLDDPGIDAVILRAKQSIESQATATELGQLSLKAGKPVFYTMGSAFNPAAVAMIDETAVSWHATPSRAARAAGAVSALVERQKHVMGRSAAPRPVARQALTLPSGGGPMSEAASRACLDLYGIPLTRGCRLSEASLDGLSDAPVAFPVVVKVNSPDLPHKTEADAVRVGMRSLDELKRAGHEVLANSRRYKPDAAIEGVLVQEMAQGLELIAGAVDDPCFGPVVVLGFGGIFAEILQDVSYRFAPFSAHEAGAMVAELKGHALLKGYRGQPPANLAALCDALSRLSWLIADHAGRVQEVDINPLFVNAEGVLAADALIICTQT
jgi:acyl-CoA synthetase (NDP forming)